MIQATFLLASQAPYRPEAGISDAHYTRLRSIESELTKHFAKKEEDKEATGSSSDQTSNSNSREESKGDVQNQKFDFSRFGEEVGSRSLVEALMKVTADDYYQDNVDYKTLPALTAGEFALLAKLCDLLPPTGDFNLRFEKLK